MDFLNQATAQIRELFQSMTPGSRIATGLLLVVAVVSLAYLFNSQTSGAGGYLMGGEPISASQLPAMEAAFAKAGLTGYEIVGNRVRIPTGQNAVYMGALADAGALPPNFGSYLNGALANESMFEGKHAKQMRMKVATQSELSLILRSMHGIENASVLYDIEKGKGLSRNDKVTATVSVKPIGSEPLDAKQVPMIRNLVAGAIAGLKRENVTVADLNGRTYTGGGEDGLGSPDEDPYYSRKHMVENNLKNQIDGALAYVPGVLVQVFAELNPEIKHIEDTVKLDPKTVAVRTEATSETDNQKGSSPGGRPGLAVHGPGGPAAAVGGAPTGRTTSTEVEKTTERTENMVAHDSLKVEKQGLTPEKVKVTVVVPSKYYLQVWNEQNKPAEGEEPQAPDPKALDEIQETVKKNIQDAVVALLPEVPAGTDPYPQVTVTTFQSLAGEPLPETTSTEHAMAWVGQYWSTLSMTGLALFSLMMLRSMVKSAPSSPAAVAASSAPGQEGPSLSLVSAEEMDEDDNEDEDVPRLKRRVRKGPNLKDDLTEMVREDPEAAATILRSWINNAG